MVLSLFGSPPRETLWENDVTHLGNFLLSELHPVRIQFDTFPLAAVENLS